MTRPAISPNPHQPGSMETTGKTPLTCPPCHHLNTATQTTPGTGTNQHPGYKEQPCLALQQISHLNSSPSHHVYGIRTLFRLFGRRWIHRTSPTRVMSMCSLRSWNCIRAAHLWSHSLLLMWRSKKAQWGSSVLTSSPGWDKSALGPQRRTTQRKSDKLLPLVG